MNNWNGKKVKLVCASTGDEMYFEVESHIEEGIGCDYDDYDENDYDDYPEEDKRIGYGFYFRK